MKETTLLNNLTKISCNNNNNNRIKNRTSQIGPSKRNNNDTNETILVEDLANLAINKTRESENLCNNSDLNKNDENLDQEEAERKEFISSSSSYAAAIPADSQNNNRQKDQVEEAAVSEITAGTITTSSSSVTSSREISCRSLPTTSVDDFDNDDHDEKSSTCRPENMNSQKRKRSAGSGHGGSGVEDGGGLLNSSGYAQSRSSSQNSYVSSGIGKASFIHALVVIFLEFFAWGLLTDQVITVLNDTFPDSTFLANGLIHGLKGILSFLSAPLIGAMSDIWGRKVFLLITVFFTCLPIPLMRINPMWYFAMISISGLFAVTFSVVFAYVADVTDESNRTTAYGLVSATFAASLITSPALGSYLSRFYSENFVVALATAIAIFDLFFILVAVPESLPEKIRERSKGISWDKVDPFKSLHVIFKDRTITLLCITVFLSYLPEAGQYSCFFVYLKLIVGFSQQQVAYFIAYVGILSCIAQAAILVILIRYFGSRQSIIIGLTFQVLQLALYGFAAQSWLIWFSGFLAAISSIGYPAISAYISNQSHVDQQGVSQGMVTGIRGMCNGIGPALYGFVFWLFKVNLNETASGGGGSGHESGSESGQSKPTYASTHLLPGPPFLFGSVLALVAIFVTWLIPASKKPPILLSNSTTLLSKYNKDKDNTLVKIGNTSTYNRTSSSVSITQPSDQTLQGTSKINNHHYQYTKTEFSSNKDCDEMEHLLVGHHHNQIFDPRDQNQHEQQQKRLFGATSLEDEMLNGGMTGVLNKAYSSSSLDIQQKEEFSEHNYPNYNQCMPLNEIGGLQNTSTSKHQQLSVNINRDTNLLNTTNAATATTMLNMSHLPVLKHTHTTLQQNQQHSVHQLSTKIKIDPSSFMNQDGANGTTCANNNNNNSTNTITPTTSSPHSTTTKFFNYQSNTKLNLD